MLTDMDTCACSNLSMALDSFLWLLSMMDSKSKKIRKGKFLCELRDLVFDFLAFPSPSLNLILACFSEVSCAAHSHFVNNFGIVQQCQWQLQLWYLIPLRSSPSRDEFEFCAVLPVFSIHVSDLREEVCLGKKARGLRSTTLLLSYFNQSSLPSWARNIVALEVIFLCESWVAMLSFMKFCQLFNVLMMNACMLTENTDCQDVCKPCWQGSCDLARHFAIFKALRDKYSSS